MNIDEALSFPKAKLRKSVLLPPQLTSKILPKRTRIESNAVINFHIPSSSHNALLFSALVLVSVTIVNAATWYSTWPKAVADGCRTTTSIQTQSQELAKRTFIILLAMHWEFTSTGTLYLVTPTRCTTRTFLEWVLPTGYAEDSLPLLTSTGRPCCTS